MGFELFLVELIEHVQEILNVSQLFGGKIEVSADSVPVGVCSNGWNVA